MHYDIRLKCPVSGFLEATEDIGYPTRESAQTTLDMLNEGSAYSKYVIVECRHPGSHECHDVDVAYHIHWAEHMGETGRTFERWLGAPTDEMIRSA